MANLSNINNKFLFTDGDFLKIGNLAPINNISGTESGISVTNGNCASITLDNSAASGKTFVIYSAVNGSLNFFDADAASGRLIIDSSGNSTFAGNVSTGNLTVTNTTSGWTAYINNNIGSGTQSGLLLDAGSSSADFAMYVRNAAGSSDFFAIKGNGNLGIGTSLPEGKLDVVDGNAIMTFKAGSSDRPYLQLRHDAVPVDGEELAIMDFSGYNDASQNTRYVILTAKAEDVTDGSEDGSLSLLTMKDGTATNTMSLRSGSVGIGTTSPGTKLQVGDGTADDTIRTVFSDGSYTDIHGYGLEMSRGFSYIRPTTSNTQTLYIGDQAAGNNWSVISNNASTHIWRNSSSEKMRIDSSGRVGIGTSDIEETLTIAKTDGGDGTIVGLRSDASFSQFEIATKNSQVDWGLQTIGARNMYFTTNASERMRIDSSGFTTITHSGAGASLTLGQSGGISINENVGFLNFYSNDPSANSSGGVGGIGVYGETAFGGNTPSYMSFFTHDTSPNDGTVLGNVTERMRIDSDGQVQVRNRGGGGADLILYNTDTTIGLNQMIGRLGFYKSDASGSGVGVSSSIQVRATDSGAGSFMAFHTDGETPATQETERMRITSGGDVLFGTQGLPNGTSIYGSAFHKSTVDRMILRMATSITGAAGLIDFFNPNGQVGYIATNGTATQYVTSSDYRLKEDLQDFNGLDKVSKISVYDFKWKTDKSRSYGVMAHELQEVLPDAVSGEKDAEEMQGVDYSKIVPLLVKSIQELKADNDSLKARIETLENN